MRNDAARSTKSKIRSTSCRATRRSILGASPRPAARIGSRNARATTTKKAPIEKADLVDKLLSSLHQPDQQPDQTIGELWAKEAEGRLDAYERKRIKAVSPEQVLSKHKE